MATDDLIAALQGVGKVDSEGSFSFDREKAREKLRTFQVAEPQRYVLHFIALAALKGATRIEVKCDSDDLFVCFDGATITSEDLEDLYNASFAAAHDDVQRARQQLAVGIHAALALNPRHVRIVSGADGVGVSMLARHDAADVVEPARDARGTLIHVKQRFRPGLVVRFLRNLRGGLAETTWLRARGVHATLPITLNGETVSSGLTLAGAEHCRSGSEEHCQGVAGLLSHQEPGVVRLVRHGVWICDEPCAWLPTGLTVVVANDRLLTDLSGDKVVQDEEHARCLNLARQLAAEVVGAAIGPGAAVDPEPLLRDRLHGVWQRWDGALSPFTTIGAAMLRIVAWPDLWGRRHTFAALLAEAHRLGHLPMTTADVAKQLQVTDEIIVKAGDAFMDEVVALGLGDRLRDVTDELLTRARTESNRRRWRAQPCEPRLTAANYLVVAEFGAQVGERHVRGQAGLRRAPGEKCHVRVIVDGCALTEFELAAPIAGVDVVLAGPFAILDDYSGPRRDELFAAALATWVATSRVLVEDALRRGLLDWPAGPAAQALVQGLAEVCQAEWALRRVLSESGYSGEALVEHMQALLPLMPVEPVPKDLAEQPWIRDRFQFVTATGPKISVGAVGVALARAVPVYCVSDESPANPGLTEMILRVSARERDLLGWCFGDRIVELTSWQYQQRCAAADFLTRPVEPLMLDPAKHTSSVIVDQDGLKVAMAFPRDADGWEAYQLRSSCDILHSSRSLARVKIWSPVPGVSFAIAGDGLTPRPAWDGVRLDDAYHAAVAKVAAAVPALVREAIVYAGQFRFNDSGIAWRRGVLAALIASFPSPQLRAAYARLLAARGPEVAGERYLKLLAIAATSSVHALSRAIVGYTGDLGILMDTRQVAARVSVPVPTLEQVEHVASVLREIRAALGQVGGDDWSEHIGNFSPEVAELPLFRRVSGSTLTLAEAAAAAKKGALHVYVDSGGRPPPEHWFSLHVDAIVFEQLGCLFGVERVSTAPRRDAEDEETRHVRRPTSTRPQLEPEPPRPRQELPEDPPPTATDLAALFAELEREANEKPAEPPRRPAPAATPAVQAPSTPPPPGPGERLVAAVQAELEALRRGHESLLTGFNLDHVRALTGRGEAPVAIAGDGLVIDLAHPLIQQALERHTSDRMWVSFLASRIYTALNVWREDLTDSDEAAFHARHLEWLRGELERQSTREDA